MGCLLGDSVLGASVGAVGILVGITDVGRAVLGEAVGASVP